MPASAFLTSVLTSPAERRTAFAVNSTSRVRSRRLICDTPVVGMMSATWRSGTIFGEPSALLWLEVSIMRDRSRWRALSGGRRTLTS